MSPYETKKGMSYMINGNKDVMDFINEFYNRCGENTDADKKSIRDQFMIGYCYYFAQILKSAFNRGTVCWVVGGSHIVWLDDDGIAYDADGVFNKYPTECNKSLISEDRIVPYMKSFKHVPSDTYSRTDHEWFVEFCKTNNIEN